MPRERTPKPSAPSFPLDKLKSEEAQRLLMRLIDEQPDLAKRAQVLAYEVVTDIDIDAVADALEEAVMGLTFGDLNARAGRQEWGGYVEPDEAAAELFAEVTIAFYDDLERLLQMRAVNAAVDYCEALVRGFYMLPSFDDSDGTIDHVTGYMLDQPPEAASHAIYLLFQGLDAKAKASACEDLLERTDDLEVWSDWLPTTIRSHAGQ